MKFAPVAAMVLIAAALAGCVTPVGPVQVTRFHDPQATTALGLGTIGVQAAAGQDPDSLEMRSYQEAVGRELQRVGYTQSGTQSGTQAGADPSAQIAEVRVRRSVFDPGRTNSPVSVGVGAGTGSFGSGIGLGLGIDLSGAPKEQVITELGVMIKDRASGATIWEGRASFTATAGTPLAQTQLGAAKMAEALFRDFPGNNGETIAVR